MSMVLPASNKVRNKLVAVKDELNQDTRADELNAAHRPDKTSQKLEEIQRLLEKLEVSSRQFDLPSNKCEKCGKNNHTKEECIAHLQCRKCEKYGHFARNCRTNKHLIIVFTSWEKLIQLMSV
ncbi:hypothetical protein RF11_16467 [Thelohanellus kitauei]|uniref:CCHC-type domain-containing protein n=1 Tax=Thelohanellus kitauei TaxID=669202 RepID=A0A0C2MWW7_THEKT|nr:hypothetical protein RF11_16467 [Thelohanellus kitauei]